MILSFLAGVLLTGAGEFERHDLAVLRTVAESKAADDVPELPLDAFARLPQPLAEHASSAMLVLETPAGNWCKLLVRRGRVKQPRPTDLVLIERLVTYDAGTGGTAADRRTVHLYPGLGLDADSGQIVPDSLAPDLRLTADGRLQPADNATLYVVGRPLVEPVRPTAAIDAMGEFGRLAGTWDMNADGRWKGRLTLSIDDAGAVGGTYRSGDSGRTYSLTGTAGNPLHHLRFTVELPQTRQSFDGYLWTNDPSRMSGVTTLNGHTFGFAASRP